VTFPLGLLAGAVVIQAASAPGQTVGLAVLVDPIIEHLDTTRSAVASAYMVGTLLGALALRPVGRLLDRHGVRRMAFVLGLAFGVVVAAMAGVTGVVTLTIGFVGTRALGQGALSLTASTAVVVGFDRRRGFAIGLKAALGGALMALVPLGVVVLLATVGLTTTWIVLGVMSAVVVVGVAVSPVLDQREAPADAGPTLHRSSRPTRSWSAKAALRTPEFRSCTAAVALSALVVTALTFHHIDLMAARGLDTAEAAANFLPQTVAGALSAIWVGRLADRFRPQALLGTCTLSVAATCLAVQVVRPGVVAVFYGMLLGVSGAAIRTVEATALSRWFGLDHIGEIRGVVLAVAVAASALGPVALALAADHLGGYAPVLWVFAGIGVALAVTTWRVRDVAQHPGSGSEDDPDW